MADYRIEELGGKTPLQFAATPNMDMLARCGELGMVLTVPEGLPPGSDVANLSVLGYDPRRYYRGRSSIEAVSMGIALGSGDTSFRVNLVTLSDAREYECKVMLSHSAGDISTAEALELIEAIHRRLGNEKISFYAGVGYRHLMVWKDVASEFTLTPPHDITDRTVGEYLPHGEKSGALLDLMRQSVDILSKHAVNQQRIKNGLPAANSIWIWGEGRRISLPDFKESFGLKGTVISAVDLTKGLGLCAGLKSIDVEGATGGLDTNYRGKARAALRELHDGQDFVFVHVEAPDEAGHLGDTRAKIEAIEKIDSQVLGELLPGLEAFDDFKLLVLPDHPTPLSLRTHVAEAVPFVIYHNKSPRSNDVSGFDEGSARLSGLEINQGHCLMSHFLKTK